MKERKLKILVTAGVTMLFTLVCVMVLQFVSLAVSMNREKNLEKAIASLEMEINSLEKEIEYKKSMEYVEKHARENLSLYRPDDVVFYPKG